MKESLVPDYEIKMSENGVPYCIVTGPNGTLYESPPSEIATNLAGALNQMVSLGHSVYSVMPIPDNHFLTGNSSGGNKAIVVFGARPINRNRLHWRVDTLIGDDTTFYGVDPEAIAELVGAKMANISEADPRTAIITVSLTDSHFFANSRDGGLKNVLLCSGAPL